MSSDDAPAWNSYPCPGYAQHPSAAFHCLRSSDVREMLTFSVSPGASSEVLWNAHSSLAGLVPWISGLWTYIWATSLPATAPVLVTLNEMPMLCCVSSVDQPGAGLGFGPKTVQSPHSPHHPPPLATWESEAFCFCLLVLPHGMWDLSSWTRDRTRAPGSGSTVFTTGPPGKSLGPIF